MLAEHRRVLHESAFRRLHCNQNLPADDAFISADQWDACGGPIDIPVGSTVVAAVDAGIRRDSTAVVTVRKDDRGIFHAGFEIWTPTRKREVRLEDVEEHILALCERFEVQMVAFDKHLFIGSAQRLEEAGAPMIEHPQNNSRMVPATQLLHEVIATRRLRHGGDPTARSHALAAVVGETEMGIRIRKTASRDRIDSLVALAMAVSVTDAMPAPRRSVYDVRLDELRRLEGTTA
jgi:phage terminase large subunit-like protein